MTSIGKCKERQGALEMCGASQDCHGALQLSHKFVELHFEEQRLARLPGQLL
jgi:hypothetical protein